MKKKRIRIAIFFLTLQVLCCYATEQSAYAGRVTVDEEDGDRGGGFISFGDGEQSGGSLGSFNQFALDEETKTIWQGWLSFEQVNVVNGLEYKCRPSGSVSEAGCYLYCTFNLKSQLDDGSLVDYVVTKKVSVSSYEFYFDYPSLIAQAPAFQQKKVGISNTYTYNTVVSSAEFYYVDLGTGEITNLNHYDLVWDSDLWNQECVGVGKEPTPTPTPTPTLAPDETPTPTPIPTEEPTPTPTPTPKWYDTDSLMDDFGELLLGVPKVLYSLYPAILAVITLLVKLVAMLFPFIPRVFWLFFAFLLSFSILLGIWHFIKR